MSTAQESPPAKAPRALDEATMELVRRRIGIPVSRSIRQQNEVSSTDSFRNFANAYGDDNPLYCSRDYAAASSWGESIAPPLYPYASGIMRKPEWTDEQKAELAGGDPLASIGQYMCGDRWLFARPVRAGDIMYRTQALASAELKPSSFGGGVGALVSHQQSWFDADNVPFAIRMLDYWHADRDKSRKSGKNRTIEDPNYTDDDLAKQDEIYASETIQGASPRLVADLTVGDTLGPTINGPMAVNDIVCWHTGVGLGDFGAGALKIGYKNRMRVPRFYQKNEYGFWEAAQRAHWSVPWARQLGHPRPYDYGFMRTSWMVHMLTDWMGDDAFIWKLSCSVRKFNYIGDVHLVTGSITAVDAEANTVTIDMKATNQRDEVTCIGQAVIVLPATAGATATLPTYRPEDMLEATTP